MTTPASILIALSRRVTPVRGLGSLVRDRDKGVK